MYKQRLSNLPTIVPMVYNQPVRAVIDRYATRNRALVSYMLGMMKLYMPEIEQALDYYNVPNELKYLPVIESALNPKDFPKTDSEESSTASLVVAYRYAG